MAKDCWTNPTKKAECGTKKQQNQKQLPSQPLPKQREEWQAKSKKAAKASFEKSKRAKSSKNLKSSKRMEPKGWTMAMKTSSGEDWITYWWAKGGHRDIEH